METNTILLVQSSFRKLKPLGQGTATYFYDKLLELDPDLKGLYFSNPKESIQEFGAAFMNILATTVSYLDNFKQLKPILYNLGKVIQSKQFKPTFFDFIGTAFMASLSNSLQEEFTLEVELAWFQYFQKISQTVQL